MIRADQLTKVDHGTKTADAGSLNKAVIMGRQLFNYAWFICCIANALDKANGRGKATL